MIMQTGVVCIACSRCVPLSVCSASSLCSQLLSYSPTSVVKAPASLLRLVFSAGRTLLENAHPDSAPAGLSLCKCWVCCIHLAVQGFCWDRDHMCMFMCVSVRQGQNQTGFASGLQSWIYRWGQSMSQSLGPSASTQTPWLCGNLTFKTNGWRLSAYYPLYFITLPEVTLLYKSLAITGWLPPTYYSYSYIVFTYMCHGQYTEEVLEPVLGPRAQTHMVLWMWIWFLCWCCKWMKPCYCIVMTGDSRAVFSEMIYCTVILSGW